MTEPSQVEAEPDRVADDDWLRPRRLSSGRMIGGVAAGLSEWLGIPVVVIRLAFVIVGLLSGIGVLIYLALLLALPEDEGIRTGSLRLRRIVAIVLCAVAFVILLAHFELPSSRLLLPVLFVGIGLALWRPSPRHRPSPRPMQQPDTPVAATESRATGATDTARLRRRLHRKPVRLPREPSSPLGRITIAVALAALAVALLADRSDAFDLTLSRGVSLLLVVIGTGLLVGARYGRARWLVLLAAPLAVLLPVASTLASLGVDPFGYIGSRSYVVDSSVDSASSYAIGIGALTVDLRDVPAGTALPPIAARAAIGRLEVMVPPSMRVVVHSRVGWGTATIEDYDKDSATSDTPPHRPLADDNGRNVDITTTMPGTPGGASVTIEATVGLGAIRVMRSVGPSPRVTVPTAPAQPTTPAQPTSPTLPSSTPPSTTAPSTIETR